VRHFPDPDHCHITESSQILRAQGTVSSQAAGICAGVLAAQIAAAPLNGPPSTESRRIELGRALMIRRRIVRSRLAKSCRGWP
jgi:hypothetical protein